MTFRRNNRRCTGSQYGDLVNEKTMFCINCLIAGTEVCLRDQAEKFI